MTILAVGLAPRSDAEVCGPGCREDRCVELDNQAGAECSASESMNTGTHYCYPLPPQQDKCFANTTNSQCNPLTGAKPSGRVWRCPFGVPLAAGAAGVDLPSGHSLSWVMQANCAGTSTMDEQPCDSMSGNTKRYCMRAYRKYSPGYIVIGPSKLMENQNGRTITQFAHTGQNFYVGGLSIWQFTPGSGELGTTPTMKVADCSSVWCRFEMCVSAPSQALLTNFQDITLEYYITQVGIESPKSGTNNFFLGDIDPQYAGSMCSEAQRMSMWYHENCTGAEGFQYATSAMTAVFDSNALGTFIGPAVEVEGNVGPPPPPPIPTLNRGGIGSGKFRTSLGPVRSHLVESLLRPHLFAGSVPAGPTNGHALLGLPTP